jgi:hypothetical protein
MTSLVPARDGTSVSAGIAQVARPLARRTQGGTPRQVRHICSFNNDRCPS